MDLRADILTDVRPFIFAGGRGVGVDCFFRSVGGAFEVEFVAVGIGEDGDPHIVADEGRARGEAAGAGFVEDGEGVFALEADGDAFP